MNSILDKAILLICCCALLAYVPASALTVISLLLAIIAASLLSYLSYRYVSYILPAVYSLLALFFPELAVFLPLVYYDAFYSCPPYLYALGVVPLFLGFSTLPVACNIMVFLFLAVSYALSYRTRTLENSQAKYRELRDQSWETSLYLESKNKDLMEKQDYEIRLATLNERNRIAREIHDNVGHMLSRSILQVGALMAVCRDDSLNPELSALKSTLTDAMDSIRKSVHDLHDDSINLHDALTAILSAYKFCPVRLDDGIESIPPAPVRYCFSAIVREALSNTARHSDATQVTVTLREHPALYQLLIRDNGTKNPPASSNGIGLSNMAERVASLGGHFRTDFKNGFHIFISIPKGEQQNERTSDRR